MSLTFHNPVADCEVPVNPYILSIDLSGPATVALVINKIVDCDTFMSHVGDALLNARPGISLRYYDTGKITFADDGLMDQVAAECDAAVCAIGHCGSCTAGTVKDGIALINRGRPAVSLVTEVFWEQGNMLARSLGWPDSPRVRLPYPIWGVDSSSMKSVANTIAPEIIHRLDTVNADPA